MALFRHKVFLATLISISMFTLCTSLFAPVAKAKTLPSQITKSDNSCTQIPTNVDPTKFSDSQLQQYGLPKRPGNMSDTDWNALLTHAKLRYCNGTQTNVREVSEEFSSNWTGNIGIGSGYQVVQSYFYVPCVSSHSSNVYSSQWVGLGGDDSDGGGNLVQTGIESDWYNGSPSYYAWYEDYPANPYSYFVFSVNCGDKIYAQSDDNYSMRNYAYMFIEDITRGVYSAEGETEQSNGSTAEWITERPELNNQFPPLVNFNSITFFNDYTLQNGVWKGVGNVSHNYSIMCSGGWWTCGPFSTQLAYPGGISNNLNFTNYWQNYGSWDNA